MERTIKNILYGAQFDMGGFPVRQPFPAKEVNEVGPFLLLHHAKFKVPTHIPTEQSGVGPHPHRGFAPVTFIIKGGVRHRDSRGHDHIVYEGGIQWMEAGMGIIHSERPPRDIHERGGLQEIIQLWVNSPAKHKMDIPRYMPAAKEEIPALESEDKLVTIQIVSGNLNNKMGIIPTRSPVNTFVAHFKKGGIYHFPLPPTHEAFAYLLEGKTNVGTTTQIEPHHAIVLNKDGDGISIEALEDSILLIGSGEPLNEPVASHGPFVMNTETEILEAFRDYKMGKMGILIEN